MLSRLCRLPLALWRRVDGALRRVETAGEALNGADATRALFLLMAFLILTIVGVLATFMIPSALESVPGVPAPAIAVTLHMAGFFRKLILLVGALCAVFGIAFAGRTKTP